MISFVSNLATLENLNMVNFRPFAHFSSLEKCFMAHGPGSSMVELITQYVMCSSMYFRMRSIPTCLMYLRDIYIDLSIFIVRVSCLIKVLQSACQTVSAPHDIR